MIINAIKDGVGITGGGGSTKPPVLEQLNATENGTYTPSDGVDGFNPVSVDVQPPLQTKAIEITANGQSTIEADSEYYGLESVGLNVNVPIPTFQTEELSVASNGTYTPSTDGYSKVSVNVQPKLQAKSTTTTITKNGTSTITLEPDANYDGLSSASVDINVDIPIPEFTTEELVATANGTYTPSTNGYSKVRVNVSEPVSKYVVPNGMKFAKSKVFNVEDFDMSQVTDMSEMLFGCSGLTSLDLSTWNVSKVTDMSYMFYECSKLTSLDIGNWNVSNLTNMSSMFNGCNKLTSLGISGWNVSNVTDMNSMFSSCISVTLFDIGGWDVSNVTNMRNMFGNCTALPSLGLSNWNVSRVINMYSMFNWCKNLTSLDLSNWNMSNVTDMRDMFYFCRNLTDLNMNGAILPKMNLTNWNLSSCNKLTIDSLVSVLNALQQLDDGTSYTCTIGSDNLNKLSDEQKAIATNKGWVLN